MQAAFLEEFRQHGPQADTTADQTTRVWTAEKEIQVYQKELGQIKQADIFANESSRDFLRDDFYKGS